MKIDRRELAGGPRTVLFIAESEDESQIFDWAFGNQVVDSDGLIAYVVGQDGYTITKRHGTDPRFPDGVEVWVHPEGIVIPVDADGDSPGWRHYFKTFFLELPDSCAC